MTSLDNWVPKTKVGKMVKSGEIKTIDEILDKGYPILEEQIVETLIPDLEMDLMLIGQSKGKFGGGKRRAFKQTQKKTADGSRIKFTCLAIVGNKNGYIGMGAGSSNETVPAKEKAIRAAKLNIIRIKRGCGSWECACAGAHSIPFKIAGKSGSVSIMMKPAPKGLGLAIANECKKILQLAGIKDVWSKTSGQTHTRRNLAFACFNALKELTKMKMTERFERDGGVREGRIDATAEEIAKQKEGG